MNLMKGKSKIGSYIIPSIFIRNSYKFYRLFLFLSIIVISYCLVAWTNIVIFNNPSFVTMEKNVNSILKEISYIGVIPITASLLIHEYGHFVAFSEYDIPSRVELMGTTPLDEEEARQKITIRKDINITMMGCVFNYFTGTISLLLGFFILGYPTEIGFLLTWVGIINIFIGGANMLPVNKKSDGYILLLLWRKRN